MSIKLLVRQGGGAASQPDFANLVPREGTPIFDQNVSLIEMGQRWEQGQAAQGSFKFVDPTANSGYHFRPHASVKLIENAGGSDIIIAWNRIEGGVDTGRNGPYIAADDVEHDIQTMDANIDLRGLPFKNGWSRPAEDSWERLQALHLAKLNGSSSTEDIRRSTTDITVDRFSNGHLVDATTPVDLDAVDYPAGTEVEDVLRDIMEQWGKGWGVTLHHVAGVTHKCLLIQDYDDLAKFTSALRISDQPADWDPDDLTAPTLEPHWRRAKGKTSDNSETISGLISIWGGTTDDPRHLYVETGEAPEDWETFVGVFHDDMARNATQATRRANTILNDRKIPYTSHQPSILLNPEQVHLITAGQAIETKSVVMRQGPNRHDWTWRRITEIRWEPNPDGRWWAHLELERPTGARFGGPGGGGGQPGSTSPKPAPVCELPTEDSLTEIANNAAAGWGGVYPTTSGHCGPDFRSLGASGGVGGTFAVSASTGYMVRFLIDANRHSYTVQLKFYNGDPNSGGVLISTEDHVLGIIGTDNGVECVTREINFTTPATTTHIRFQLLGKLGGWLFQGTFYSVTPGTSPDNDPDCIDYVTDPDDASPFYMPANEVIARDEALAAAIEESAEAVTIESASDPTVNDDVDDGHRIGTLWVNTSTDEAFILVDNTAGAAVWESLASSGGSGTVLDWYVVTEAPYNAVGDGTTDDTTAIQDAIDDAVAAGGGVVYFPADKTYSVTGLVVDGDYVELRGGGKSAVIAMDSGTGNTLEFDDAASRDYCVVRDLSFSPSVTRTAGAEIAAEFFSNLTLTDLAFTGQNGQINHCINLGSTARDNVITFITNIRAHTFNRFFYGVRLLDLWASHISTDANTAAANTIIIEGGVEGSTWSQCDFVNSANNDASGTGACLTIRDTDYSTTPPRFNTYQSCYFDSHQYGMEAIAGKDITFVNCWFSARPENGGYVHDADCENFVFIGCRFENCGNHGLLLNDGTNHQVIGCVAVSNDQQAGGGHGFAVASVDGLVFTGNRAYNRASFGGTQDYGLFLQTDVTQFIVKDNDLRGNGTGGINNAAGESASKLIYSNLPGDAWATYTPTVTGSVTNPTLGSSTVTGRYRFLDAKTLSLTLAFNITTGGAWNAGSGDYAISLPAGVTSAAVRQTIAAHINDNGTRRYVGTGVIGASATTIGATATADAAGTHVVGSTLPVTWATGDYILWTGTIEVA